MPSSSDPNNLRKLMIISIFASLAVVLGILESMIPFAITIPGAKLGLGNIVVLTCLVMFTGRDALWLIVIKTLLTAFILGSFSTLLFSMAGALASLLVMFLMVRAGRDNFSLLGVSIAGGVAHNLGQLSVASVVLGTSKIYYYLPLLMVSGIATGVFVGLASRYLIQSLTRMDLFNAN